ncbi:unnamed protein product [Lupinus luteus]|uniref:Uncharacterized protein n=1 Tax=Lupinus luteus TaxID=3873 RepID=A0AAV1XZP2_LUPLU
MRIRQTWPSWWARRTRHGQKYQAMRISLSQPECWTRRTRLSQVAQATFSRPTWLSHNMCCSKMGKVGWTGYINFALGNFTLSIKWAL